MSDPTGTTRIILARHGEARYPVGEPGGTLIERGRSQAQGLAEALRCAGIAAIYCSKLSRARETAGIAADLLGLDVQVCTGLQEYVLDGDAGPLEGVLLGWLRGDLRQRIPGGEDGDQVADRMLTTLDEIAHRHLDAVVLVISHGGAIIATLGRVAPGSAGLPSHPDGRLREQDIPGGSAFVLDRSPAGWHLSTTRF